MYCFLQKGRETLTERLRITSHKYWVLNWLVVSKLLTLCVSINLFCSTSLTNPHTSTVLSTSQQSRPMLQWYNTIQYNSTQYNKYNTTQHNPIQYDTTQHKPIQYNTTQPNPIQYNTIQHNAIQYNTIQYNTTQHNTIMMCLLNVKLFGFDLISWLVVILFIISKTMYQLQKCTSPVEQQVTETLLRSWQSLSWSTNANSFVPSFKSLSAVQLTTLLPVFFRFFAFVRRAKGC